MLNYMLLIFTVVVDGHNCVAFHRRTEGFRTKLVEQLPSEVLVKRVPNSRENSRTVKIYTFILVSA